MQLMSVQISLPDSMKVKKGGQLSISLSVTYLASYILDFSGSIEVEIIAEDLPSSDTQQKALFGKH